MSSLYPSPATTEQSGYLVGSGAPKLHYNMSRPITTSCTPDYASPLPAVAAEVKGLTPPRSALLVRIESVGPPSWDTRDGHRPTQAEADDPQVPAPAIYTPFHLAILKRYSGSASSDPSTAYLEEGQIGTDSFRGCFEVDYRNPPRAGDTAVVIVGDSGTGTSGVHPILQSLYRVVGDVVYNIDGRSEPLP